MTTPQPRPLTPSLELATFSLPSALQALSSPTPPSRVELCVSSALGGLTPPLVDFLALKTATRSLPRPVPINVMIRPHGESFVYAAAEIDSMVRRIQEFKEAGSDEDGFVFGCLGHQGGVDEDATRRLLDAASPRPCTFHRAFDEIPPAAMPAQLKILIALGFASVLTSGGAPNAFAGRDILRPLVSEAAGRISIIVGGGVRQTNISELKTATGARWFHSSAVVDGGEVCDLDEIEGLWRALKS
ncbi:copper homeostasis protein CutC [Amylocarpus encephaloides]|uniref:Copper homeostasis protein cutC homolog n=1 Tax=Amylocarpus encephaloides TaxID=45428 RepID=A0A9P7YKI8_9HELO|nr:copper homeostasis protein CutC [Amylocarpus encephaloides]